MEYFQEKLWVIGGYTESISGSGTQVWRSSDGVNWVLDDGQLPAPVEGHASAVHGNNLYVVGGKSLHNKTTLNPNPGQPYVWIFNGEEWTDIGSSYPPPFTLAAAGLVSHRGALYVAGGHRQVREEALKDVWRSDDGGYQWELAGQLSVGVWGHKMLSDGERMYVIRGGEAEGMGAPQSYSDVWSSIDGAEWSLESAESAVLPGAVWSNGVIYQGDLLIAGGFPGNKNAWRSTDGGESWESQGESDVLDRDRHMMAVVDFPLITPEVKPPMPYWPQQNLLNSLPRGFAGVVGILQAGGGDGKYTYSLLNAEGFTVYANGLLSVTAALAPGTQKSFLARVDSAGESAYVQLDFYVLDESLDVGHMFVVGGETADKIDEGTNDVWRSIDGGLTWAKIAVSPSSAVTLPALDDHTVFWHENKLAMFAEDTYLSADGGVTWETIEDIPLGNNIIENAAGVSYNNDMFIIGGGLASSSETSFYSTDAWRYRTNVLGQGQWFRGDAPPQHGPNLETTGCANRKALARDDGIYLVGGRCGTSDYNKSVEKFSLGTGRYTNGVWRSYSGTEWSFLVAAPFLPRIGFALLETNGSMYVIGGLARIGDHLSNEYRTLNDVWRSSDGVHWEEVPIIGNRFTRRHGHGGAVDDEGNLVIFGGRSFDLNGVNVSLAAGPFGDVWKSGDGEIWTRHTTNLPPARFDEGGAFMTFIPGKSVPSPLLSAGEITNEVPYGYQGKVARFFGIGGLPGSPFVYQLAGGSEQGFTIDESSGILSLDTAAGGVSGGVARASVVVIRDDAPSARSKIVVLAVSVSAPLELNYAVTSQGFPTVLAGALMRNLADFEITGGQNPISRELLGGGDIFALESLDSGVGRRSRLLRLNEELTTGAITLTLRVRDAYVDSGLAAAATDIEITIWAVPLTQLSPDFLSQTFAGESGTLGQLLAVADVGNTYALNPPVSGFGINAQSGAITFNNLSANTYTLTMEVRNADIAQEATLIATVIVGDALVASIQPTSVVVEAGQSVYADFATLSVSGGKMLDGGGYDITIANVTPPLPAGAEFKIAAAGGGRYLLSYESDDEVVNSLEYVVRLMVGDDYDGPTTPGTPPLEVVMTMAVSAPLELNYAVMYQGFPTVLAGAFMRNLAEFEITGGQEPITLELLGGSDIFALGSLDSGGGRRSRLLRLNQELTIGAITLTLRARDADVGNILTPATADIEITIWAVSLSAQLSPDFLSQTFVGESGTLGRLLATADEYNIYALNPPVSGFDINAQSGTVTLDNLSANTYTLTMEVRNVNVVVQEATVIATVKQEVIATVIVGDALTASIQPTSVVVEAGQSVYADFATLSVSGGKMFDGGGYDITIVSVTPPLPAGAEITIVDDGGGRYLLSYESDAEVVNSLEYVVRLLVGDDYDGPTTPGTPPLEVVMTMASAAIELNYALTSQGFPTVLAGTFMRNLAEFEITGSQNPITLELLGGSDIFALESLDSGVGRRSRLLRLNQELTIGAITLTLRVRDADVDNGLAAAETDIEITIWAVPLTQLSPDFIGQTFAGESGTLGQLLAVADEGNTYALNPPVSGFGISAQSGAITLGNLSANTYTLTMEVRNADAAQEATLIAAIIVGDALTASIQPTPVVVEAGQSVYADFATLSVSGGKMFDGGGYDITIVSVTPPLPAGAEFTIADDDDGRYLLSYESDAEVINSLEYVVRLMVGDDYDGPTTPGTPPLEVVMTMAVSAPLELNYYALTSQGFPTVLAGAFVRDLGYFEITGGQEPITLELLGGSDIFALESFSGVGRHSRLLRLNKELTTGAITLTLRARDADVGNALTPATADIEITIWAVSLSAQLSPDFISQTFAGESGTLGRLLAVADDYNIYALNPPVSGFGIISAQSGAIITLGNLSANTYTLTMEVRNADAAQEFAVIATVIVGDAFTASIQPTSVVVEAGQSVYADFATLSVSGGKMFDGGGYDMAIVNVTPPLPAGAEFTITDDDDGRYLLSYESDAEVNSLEYVVRLLVGDDYNGPTTPGTPLLEVMVTMTVP